MKTALFRSSFFGVGWFSTVIVFVVLAMADEPASLPRHSWTGRGRAGVSSGNQTS